MPWWYLVTALWGGQDGSLLWWSFLVVDLDGAGHALRSSTATSSSQPYVLATLMSIIGFFGVLMLFAANPFSVSAASVPLDGEGLNPLLQNYWMMIHPPTLYMGFVGWSVPFAFVRRGADHRSTQGRVDPRGAQVGAGGLDVPRVRQPARRAVVVRRARLGRLLGLGSGRERGLHAAAWWARRTCTR